MSGAPYGSPLYGYAPDLTLKYETSRIKIRQLQTL
jgi:hypothetical protein